VQGSNFEQLKCQNCNGTYNGQQFSLNSVTQYCDLLNVVSNDGAGLPASNLVTYTGSDGGICTAQCNQCADPTNCNIAAPITSVAFEALLVVILGFIGMMI